MKTYKVCLTVILAFFLTSLTSCEAIETVFNAGMYWGIFLVVAIVAIMIYLFSKGKK